MSAIIALLIVLVALGIVGLPLFRGSREAAVAAEDSEFQDLVSAREAAFKAISELDADHDMGNLSEKDYRELKERYQEKALAAIKCLDEWEQLAVEDLSDEIEAEVRSVRGAVGRTREAATVACSGCGAQVDPGDKFCAGCGTPVGLSCPGCGAGHAVAARFCAKCGAQLRAEPSSV